MENMDASILRGEPMASLYPGGTDSADGKDGMDDWSLYDVDDDALGVWASQLQRLDATVARFDSLDDHAPVPFDALTVRSILMALVMEYARHNDHADLVRERLDGRVGY